MPNGENTLLPAGVVQQEFDNAIEKFRAQH